MAAPFVILVEQMVNDGAMDAYLDAIRENARASRQEAGCLRFDVLRVEDSSNTVMLYEIYVDEAAFQAHRETKHFAKFDSLRKLLIKGSRVTRLRLEDSDST
ncbi:MAG: antibiotic biosynthesis monooxygenase [Candidatus Eremiobacteraeota bacterium]|nr:antibiotic biosynthesis monooxygenase [Candidatus Eremiobacteraeota bacterium]